MSCTFSSDVLPEDLSLHLFCVYCLFHSSRMLLGSHQLNICVQIASTHVQMSTFYQCLKCLTYLVTIVPVNLLASFPAIFFPPFPLLMAYHPPPLIPFVRSLYGYMTMDTSIWSISHPSAFDMFLGCLSGGAGGGICPPPLPPEYAENSCI